MSTTWSIYWVLKCWKLVMDCIWRFCAKDIQASCRIMPSVIALVPLWWWWLRWWWWWGECCSSNVCCWSWYLWWWCMEIVSACVPENRLECNYLGKWHVGWVASALLYRLQCVFISSVIWSCLLSRCRRRCWQHPYHRQWPTSVVVRWYWRRRLPTVITYHRMW